MKGVHCVLACIFACVCVCHRGILSYALLSAMSVISSKNPSDMAWAAFQGYSCGLLNSRSHSAPIILMFGSLNNAVFSLILFRMIARVCSLLILYSLHIKYNNLFFKWIFGINLDVVSLFPTLNDL